MSLTTTAEPATPPEPLLSHSDNVFLRDITFDLADSARQFAQLLLERAQRAPTDEQVVRLAAAFDTISRAARRAVLLARHLARPEKPAQTPSPAAPRPPRSDRAARARHFVAEQLTEAIRAADLDPADAESAHEVLRDRLDTLDQDPTTFEGPVEPIIEALKRELHRAFKICSEPHTPPPAARNVPELDEDDLDKDDFAEDHFDDPEDFDDRLDEDEDPLDSG